MATTKSTKTNKKAKPAPVFHKSRIDIVIDEQRKQVLDNLKAATLESTSVKALLNAAHYYLNTKPRLESELSSLKTELYSKQRELNTVKSSVSDFIQGFDEMKKAIDIPAETSPGSKKCPHCSEVLSADDIDDGWCPACDREIDEDIPERGRERYPD